MHLFQACLAVDVNGPYPETEPGQTAGCIYRRKSMTIPNMISAFRMSLAPVLLLLAWFSLEIFFLAVLILAFITDAIDGPLARHFHQDTAIGSRLDSRADVSIYLAYPVGAWWLWPDVILRELVFVLLVIASIALPTLAGLIKFHRFTSYHTWMVKIAAVSMTVTSLYMFVFGPAWPFRIATVLCIIAGLEEILITLTLKEPRSNVRSLWYAKKM